MGPGAAGRMAAQHTERRPGGPLSVSGPADGAMASDGEPDGRAAAARTPGRTARGAGEPNHVLSGSRVRCESQGNSTLQYHPPAMVIPRATEAGLCASSEGWRVQRETDPPG